MNSPSMGSRWTRDEEKAFEYAISELGLNNGEDIYFTEIARRIETKSAMEAKLHFEALMEDLDAIENGRVPIPNYVGEEENESKGGNGTEGSKTEIERRRGTPWSEEEHRRFLVGLKKYGKGDWRSISRNCVLTRTPTQVASHAQKYFARVHTNRDRRRSSIHDIRLPNSNDQAASTQTRAPQFGPSPSKALQLHSMPHPQHHQQLLPLPSMNMYGNSMGRPLQGHMASGVVTTAMLPNGIPRNLPYNMPDSYMVQPGMMRP